MVGDIMTEWKLGVGTGNAKCRVCGKLIKEGQPNIKIVNSRISGQIHSNPFDCGKERQEQLGFEYIGDEEDE
tara:strand:- start:1381 stop:1596 length:216 start_codon:yes stop_codon:yes gene_type:complete